MLPKGPELTFNYSISVVRFVCQVILNSFNSSPNEKGEQLDVSLAPSSYNKNPFAAERKKNSAIREDRSS